MFCFFFFSLLHQPHVSGRLTNPGQINVFLFQVFPYVVHPDLPLAPLLLLFPSTCPCKASIGSLSFAIRSTCPNHRSLLFLIFSTTVSRAPSFTYLLSCFAT